MEEMQRITALANFIDRLGEAEADACHGLPDHEWEKAHDELFKVMQTACRRLITYLAYSGDMLVGAEYCNECGEVEGTVTKIEREPDLMIITTGGVVDLPLIGNYFRLPGTTAYGDHAIAELALARANEALGYRVIAHVGHVDPNDSQSPYRPPGWLDSFRAEIGASRGGRDQG